MQHDYRTPRGKVGDADGADQYDFEDGWVSELVFLIVAGPSHLPGMLFMSAVFLIFSGAHLLFGDDNVQSIAGLIGAASFFLGGAAVALTRRDIRDQRRRRSEYFARRSVAWGAANRLDKCRDLVLGWAASGVPAGEIAARLSDDGLVVSPQEVRHAVHLWEDEASSVASEAARLVRSAKSARRR